MLHQPTIEKLLTMRLEPMVETWRSFEQDENAAQLSFEEKLSLMVDRLWTWRQNLTLERRLRYAKLKGSACVEDIDYRASRGLDRTLMRSPANDSGWAGIRSVRRMPVRGRMATGSSYRRCDEENGTLTRFDRASSSLPFSVHPTEKRFGLIYHYFGGPAHETVV